MKRQDIISKLINEGFTQKTLVNLNDKQLHMLAERVLSEQYATTGAATPSVLNIPKEKTQDISSAKTRKQTFATYEGEVKEEEKLGVEKKEKSEDEKILQRIHSKAESKMKKGECIKSEVELLKRMKKNVPEKYTKYIEVKTGKVKVKEKEPEPVSESKKVNKWVNKLVENKCFTSKGDIINLIQSKLNEQSETDVMTSPTKNKTNANFDSVLSYDKLKQIAGRNELIPGLNDYIKSLGYGEPEPEVDDSDIDTGAKAGYQPEVHPGKPDVKPDVDPNIDPGKPEHEEPWDPYNPGPGVDPGPKAKTKSNNR